MDIRAYLFTFMISLWTRVNAEISINALSDRPLMVIWLLG